MHLITCCTNFHVIFFCLINKYLIHDTICVSAQRKGPSVGIFISKKIRFYKAVQNFLKKFFICEFVCKYSLLCIH